MKTTKQKRAKANVEKIKNLLDEEQKSKAKGEDYASGIGVNKQSVPLSRKSTTAGPCRCGSTTHKRVTHSSCIFNLKNATSLNGEAAKVNPSLDGATCGEAVAHQESLSSAASQSESGINGELLKEMESEKLREDLSDTQRDSQDSQHAARICVEILDSIDPEFDTNLDIEDLELGGEDA